ncbi:MAG TPA: DUF423 domain-containing protein [Candidatus Tectomicrobia bacterium]
MMTPPLCLRLAAVSGFLVVALGAFGAHSLRPVLLQHQTLEVWEKAVLYHALHTLVLLFLASRPVVPRGAAISFLLGICLFSGSLYLLAATNVRWLGAITPLGGISFLVGWAWVFISA